MSKLAEKRYWDSVHKSEAGQRKSTIDTEVLDGAPPSSIKRKIVGAAKRLLGRRTIERMSSFDEYLLWEIIFKRHLPVMRHAKVLEVGSAPGEFLVKFSQKFDCVPYGVEYSEIGVELNRTIFGSHGINPDNVIHEDFLSEEFQQRYRNSFDIVVSRGFIEHFTDVADIIEKHLNVLVEGGYLVVNIPNLTGVNYALIRLFNQDVISIHNLNIMRKDAFSQLFDKGKLRRLFCDYYGTFSFYLFNVKEHSPMRFLLNSCFKLQPVLNLAFRLLLKDKGAESGVFSPYLLFIGQKISGAGGVSCSVK